MNNRNLSNLTRRDFLRSAGALGAALTLAGVPLRLTTASNPPAVEGKSSKVSRLVPTVCGMCDFNCGVVAYVQGDVVNKLEGNYNHSHSMGKICARGSAGVQVLYNPQRLQHPLKKNAGGRWEGISWDQALGEIGSRLRDIRNSRGPQSLAWIYHPRLSQEWDRQFMRAYGSPNIFITRSAASALVTACHYTLGDVPVPDLASSRYILMLGSNPAESVFVTVLADLLDAKDRGAHLVVADPRLSRTAAQAHEWMPIRPGTDGALILALMNVLVAEKLYDAEFVAQHTQGFAEMTPIIADSTPGWASVITGIPADAIRRLARELAAARPACVAVMGINATLFTNGVQTARAALALNALLGNYNSPGGMVLPPKVRVGLKMPPTEPVTAKRANGVGEGAIAPPGDGMAHLLPDIILSANPYPISALVVDGCNPVLSLPDRARVTRALEKLDLLVVIDVQGTETSELADYVLPESTYLERFDPVAVSQRLLPEVALRQPVIGTLYDTRPAHEIISGLAGELGLSSYFPASFETSLKEQLRSIGTTPERLERTGVWRQRDDIVYGKHDFSTRSGKIQFYLDEFKAAGFDPLPSYHPPAVPLQNGSFRLLHGRASVHTGSSTQNVGWLNKLEEDNELWINSEMAARLDIAAGDLLRVSSETGEISVKARPTRGIHPDAVFLVHGFGHDSPMQRLSHRRGASDNDLIAGRIEPISGGPALCETTVTLEKTR
ncbi:MAG: molybdopterin-dependent oxidoreductase [Chloroflexi bacterium]|nr:molybdopterin-dependent oxidoreductase [Chloroflexota bacterium]